MYWEMAEITWRKVHIHWLEHPVLVYHGNLFGTWVTHLVKLKVDHFLSNYLSKLFQQNIRNIDVIAGTNKKEGFNDDDNEEII